MGNTCVFRFQEWAVNRGMDGAMELQLVSGMLQWGAMSDVG